MPAAQMKAKHPLLSRLAWTGCGNNSAMFESAGWVEQLDNAGSIIQKHVASTIAGSIMDQVCT
jgi:hypothetical protein